MHMDAIAGSGGPFTPQPMVPTAPPRHFDDSTDDAGHFDTGRFPPQVATLLAENHELRAEIEQLRAERARMADIQTRLMDVLGCKYPDRLVHDVRNVLNERELYRALADTIPEE